jgi:membrane protease YdiL (CAAX protease family)
MTKLLNTFKKLCLNHPIWITIIPFLFFALIILFLNTVSGNKTLSYVPIALLILSSLYFTFIYYLFPELNLFKNWIDSKSKNWIWFPIIFFVTCFATFSIFDNGNSIPLIYYIKNLSVGVTEEILFRSICFGILINLFKSKNQNNYVFNAGLISAFTFGSIHILNILNIFNNPVAGDLLILTLVQVLYATFIGLGFAGHTYKNNSTLIPILVHSLINLFTDDELLANKIIQNSSIPLYVVICVIGIPYIVYGIKILMDTREIKKLNQI